MLPECDRKEIYYYFFEWKSTSNDSASSAYRSILAQVLSKHGGKGEVLDKFSFAMDDPRRNPGQLKAGKSILVDLLRVCLPRDSILILDGIDECVDCDDFLTSLVNIWKTCSPHILLLSRANVAKLQRSIPEGNRLGIPKEKISRDIRLFSELQLDLLFDEGILPTSAHAQKENMLERMVRGADGMFLWARLMTNFLRSPYIDTSQRLRVLSEINTPEGLETMYRRIVKLITNSGKFAETLASKVLMRLIYAAVPISSRQLRQTLVVDEVLQPYRDPMCIKEFEDCTIMACAGLVERTVLSGGLPFLDKEPALQVIHLSVNETWMKHHSTSCIQWRTSTPHSQLILDAVLGNLDYATNCVKQLLFHTPPQPLSGTLGRSIRAAHLYDIFCFTDYAAVSWLLHIRSFVNSVNERRLIRGSLSQDFLDCFSEFSSRLLIFLRNPKAVSVWLEAFYSSGYINVHHPPSDALCSLAAWAKDWAQKSIAEGAGLAIDTSLIEQIEGFKTEVDQVVKIWRDSLRDAPHIVWDEMTGFLSGNRYFWSSQSTKVSYQNAAVPLSCAPFQEPVASLSRTSDSGEMKATLNIWANQ